MKSHLIKYMVLVVLLAVKAFGQTNFRVPFVAPKPSEPLKQMVAPFIVKTAPKEVSYGIVTADESPAGANDPDLLNKFRDKQNDLSHNKNLTPDEVNQVKSKGHIVSIQHFTNESLTFFVASGAVTFNSMWLRSHGNPLELEKHILSLKDPVAHLSFYAFMQSQGMYLNFHTNRLNQKLIDASKLRQMMTRLTYSGMVAGTLASMVISDLGNSIAICSDRWIKGMNDNESLESCNRAWAQWISPKKLFAQYFPAVMNGLATLYVSNLIEQQATRGLLKLGIEDLSAASMSSKIRTGLKGLSTGFKVKGADIATALIPGEGEFKAVTWGIKIVGKMTQIALFVSSAKYMDKFINNPLNSMILPYLNSDNISDINKLWSGADTVQWNDLALNEVERKSKTTFEKAIEKYSENMSEWRQHINEDAEADLAGWMEMTEKLLGQIDYAYKYYSIFVESLHKTYNTLYEVQQGKLDKSAIDVMSNYPFRTLPYYGVTPGTFSPPEGGSMEEMYLMRPWEVEKNQKAYVLQIATKYRDANYSFADADENLIYQNMLRNLLSQDNVVVAQGLKVLQKVDEQYEKAANEIAFGAVSQAMPSGVGDIVGPLAILKGSYDLKKYSPEFGKVMSALHKELGKPRPLTEPLGAFSKVLEMSPVLKESMTMADYSTWSIRKKYKFDSATDLLLYKMICGHESANFSSVGPEFMGTKMYITSPEFAPPALLVPDPKRGEFCKSFTSSRSMYNGKINGQALQVYFIQHVRASAAGDFRTPSNPMTFPTWWQQYAKEPLTTEFRRFDEKYKATYELAHANFFGERSSFKRGPDKMFDNRKVYFPIDIESSVRLEMNVYFQLINRALFMEAPVKIDDVDWKGGILNVIKKFSPPVEKGKEKVIPMLRPSLNMKSEAFMEFHLDKDEVDRVRLAAKNITKGSFNSLYTMYDLDVATAYKLLEQYMDFIRYDQVDVEKYVMHSQRFDYAMNNILVKAGLKKIVHSKQESDDLSAAPVKSMENTTTRFEDIEVPHPTSKQRIITAALKGIRTIEADLKRFIRMSVVRSNSFEFDNTVNAREAEFLIKTNANRNKFQAPVPVKKSPIPYSG